MYIYGNAGRYIYALTYAMVAFPRLILFEFFPRNWYMFEFIVSNFRLKFAIQLILIPFIFPFKNLTFVIIVLFLSLHKKLC
jgi:hypothetical protein